MTNPTQDKPLNPWYSADTLGEHYTDRYGHKWVADPAGQWHPYVKQPITTPAFVAVILLLILVTIVLNVIAWS